MIVFSYIGHFKDNPFHSMPTSFDQSAFYQVPIIGILRGMKTADLPPVLEAYLKAGMTTIEITMNTPQAEEQIALAVDQFGDRLNIGAGTVRNIDEMEGALDAGASFVVTPNVDQEVITSCKHQEIPIFAGAFTPTEIYQAHQYGATMIKVFPASVLGPDYLKNVKGPLDTIELIATGGVTVQNMGAYLNAGAFGLGIGNTMFDRDLIHSGDWGKLQERIWGFNQAWSNWQSLHRNPEAHP